MAIRREKIVSLNEWQKRHPSKCVMCGKFVHKDQDVCLPCSKPTCSRCGELNDAHDPEGICTACQADYGDACYETVRELLCSAGGE